MKKAIRKWCVFLLAVAFLGKTLYGNIQYTMADEFAGDEVTITEDDVLEDISGDEVIPDGENEEDFEPDLEDPEELEPSGGVTENRNTDITVLFFVLKNGYLGTISPEQNGETVTSNGQKRYETVFAFVDSENYGLEYLLKNYSYSDSEEIKNLLKKGVIKHFALPDEYGNYESISESFGVNKVYLEGGKEYLIEDLIGNTDYVSSLFAFFMESAADGTNTGNVIYATGDMIDWYVLKHSDTDAWHADGFMNEAKALIAQENVPVPVSSVYTFDGVSKVTAVEAVINQTLLVASDSLPGSFVVDGIAYNNASGYAVSEITNVGEYVAIATVRYVYEDSNDELCYESDAFELAFPVTVNKRTVTVTAYNSSKNEGQDDPTFAGSVDGAVASDPVRAFFWRIEGNEKPGTYPIYSTVIASSNYNVVSYDGEFKIFEASEVVPEPTPTPTPNPTPSAETPGMEPPEESVVVPEQVASEETIELEEEAVPLAQGPIISGEDEISLGGDTLDVGEVYPTLRDIAIEDEETPLAAFDDCWIHWLIVLLTVIDVLYTVIQAFRNGAIIKKLKQGKE